MKTPLRECPRFLYVLRLATCIVLSLASAESALSAAQGHMPTAAAQLVADLHMANIPGGTFQMGDLIGDGKPNERPVHSVTIKPFKLAKYEVTVGQFGKFIAATGYRTEAERNVEALPEAVNGCGVLNAGKMGYRAGVQWNAPSFEQTDSNPVVCVSWNDAQEFIRWLNRETRLHFRLPSEAEWEYAARAKTTTKYFWGDAPEQACKFANAADETTPPGDQRFPSATTNCRDGYFFTSPVGHYAPNAFGLYDMLGNAREWTADCASNSYDGAPNDGSPWLTGDCTARIARGSSWFGSPNNLRVSARGSGITPARDFDMGFRLAADE